MQGNQRTVYESLTCESPWRRVDTSFACLIPWHPPWSLISCSTYKLYHMMYTNCPSHPILKYPVITKIVLHFKCVNFFLSPDTDNQLFELGCEELGWPGGPDGGSEESEQFLDYGIWELWRHYGYCSEYYFVSLKYFIQILIVCQTHGHFCFCFPL